MERLAFALTVALVAAALAGMILRWTARTLVGTQAMSPARRYAVLLTALAGVPLVCLSTLLRLARGAEVVAAPAPALLAEPGARAVIHTLASAAGPLCIAVACIWIIAGVRRSITIVRRSRATATLRDTSNVVPPWLQRMAGICAARIGVAEVDIAMSSMVDVPCVIGVVRPVIVIPEAIDSVMTPDQIQLILAHELAHIRRRDPAANLVQVIIEAWFPVAPVRHISRLLREQRELACDHVATLAFGQPLVLARALERLETVRAQRHHMALAADDAPLLSRIENLIHSSDRKPNSSHLATAALPIVAALIVAAAIATPPALADDVSRLAAPAARFAQNISAHDDAGEFTISVVAQRAVAATFDGRSFPASRIRQRGSSIRFLHDNGRTLLAVDLQPAGGMKWTSR